MSNIVSSRQYRKWDYFLVFLFLATSGATFWHGMSPAIAFLFFLIMAFINSMAVRKDFGKVHNSSLIFVSFIAAICFVNLLFYGWQFKDNSEIGYLVAITATYLFVSRYDFYYFRDLLTNVVCVLTLVGLIIFGLFELGLIPTYTLNTHSGTPYTMFLFYTLGWPNAFHRYTGLWHEAGACQIITNTVLWLHYRNFVEWKWGKGQLKKIFVIFLGSIFTFSTGSYIVIMLLIAAIVMNIKIKSRYKSLIYIFILIAAVVGLYIMFYSPVIQNKLFDAEGEHVSKLGRLSDINALWKMTLERPLLGYGLGTVEFWKKSEIYGNTACSSGFLTYSASLGFTWMVLFLFFVWKGIKKFRLGKSIIFMFLAIILMQFNEKFIEFPITNMLLFYFASYDSSSMTQAVMKRIKIRKNHEWNKDNNSYCML